jgi:spore germination cell wall hydrolase CwlJ-like protein
LKQSARNSRTGTHYPNVKKIHRIHKSGWRDHVPMAFGGIMLMAAFAFAGHYIGRNAEAHNVVVADLKPANYDAPRVIQSSKVSLLPEGETFATMDLKLIARQTVVEDGKGDMLLMQANAAVRPVGALPKKQVARLSAELKIEPASIDIGEDDGSKAVKRLALTPKPPKIEQSFKLNGEQKQKVLAQRRLRMAEENCLARAVYFEARSESELGQMAVAKVILNRTRMDGFPKTICGVVYQGSSKRNSCQFSFACDGLPDDVRQPGAWAQSKAIAKKVIAGDAKMGSAMGNAVNYHADYVRPKWSKTMRRLVKIGRHIFYADG